MISQSSRYNAHSILQYEGLIMKKVRFFNLVNIMITVFSLMLISIFNQGCRARKNTKANTVKSLISEYTNVPPVIDGNLDDKVWKSAKSITFDGTSRGKKTDDKGEAWTLWDKQNLYIAFNIQDKNLKALQTALDHPLLSRDDIVEFLIDPRNDKDSCWTTDDVIYHINLYNQKKDDRGTADCKSDPTWNGNAKTAVKLFGTINDSTDVDKGFSAEIAISWKELNVKPRPGFRMGIDLAAGDAGVFFDWAGASPFRSPHAFGDLILMK
jgi:hypothetical protein